MENQLQLEKFNEYMQIKGFASSTREKMTRSAERFAAWCNEQNVPVLDASYNDITAYVRHCKTKGNSARTAQIMVNRLKHYYSFLLSEEQVAENPCTNIEIRGVKRKQLYDTFTSEELEMIYRGFTNSGNAEQANTLCVTHHRNKVILGLVIYQGLRTEEIGNLELKDLKLKQGKISITGTRKTEKRELKLEAHQLYELMDYVNETRKLILAMSGKQTEKLFTSIGSKEDFGNVMRKIVKQLQKQNPRLKEIKQLRASVIVNWLNTYDLRKVQYMAGHRYVSSTESYQVNNMDGLKEDVNRYHPNL